MISRERLKERLKYNPDTGELTWLASRLKGKKAGCSQHVGGGKKYVYVRLDGRLYLAHRLIVLMVYGANPDEVDHINGNGLDNRIENLRPVNRLENSRNMRLSKSNTSGMTGIYWNKREKKWKPSIMVDGKSVGLGTYSDLFEAICARKSAENMYGFHINHGTQRPH